MADEFERVDWVCRSTDDELNNTFIEETDALITKKTDGLDSTPEAGLRTSRGLTDELQEARRVLADLRGACNLYLVLV
jgi:hypothetical protein